MSRHDRNVHSDRASLYDEITSKIITELEAGRVPWAQPWGAVAPKAPLATPKNAATGRDYAGPTAMAAKSDRTAPNAEAAHQNGRSAEKDRATHVLIPFEHAPRAVAACRFKAIRERRSPRRSGAANSLPARQARSVAL
jgi:hypothetical protein